MSFMHLKAKNKTIICIYIDVYVYIYVYTHTQRKKANEYNLKNNYSRDETIASHKSHK